MQNPKKATIGKPVWAAEKQTVTDTLRMATVRGQPEKKVVGKCNKLISGTIDTRVGGVKSHGSCYMKGGIHFQGEPIPSELVSCQFHSIKLRLTIIIMTTVK